MHAAVLAAPRFAQEVTNFMAACRQTIWWFGRHARPPNHLVHIQRFLASMDRRIQAICRRIAAGELPKPTPPASAVPAEPPAAEAGNPQADPPQADPPQAGPKPPGRERWPSRKLWMVHILQPMAHTQDWLRRVTAEPDFPDLLAASPALGGILRQLARACGAHDLLRGVLKPPPPRPRRKRGPRPKPPAPPPPAPPPPPTPWRVLAPGEPVPHNPQLTPLGSGWTPIPPR